MTVLSKPIEFEVTGKELADWWWELDSNEQSEFFRRLEQIRHENRLAFDMQLAYLNDAMMKALWIEAKS